MFVMLIKFRYSETHIVGLYDQAISLLQPLVGGPKRLPLY